MNRLQEIREKLAGSLLGMQGHAVAVNVGPEDADPVLLEDAVGGVDVISYSVANVTVTGEQGEIATIMVEDFYSYPRVERTAKLLGGLGDDVRWLIAEVERLRAEVARLRRRSL